MRLHAWLIVVFFFVSTAQAADTFPSKPIRMLVPFPAGGGIDVVGRILADQIAEQTGQQVVVDNRAGASGNIAGTVVADANPEVVARVQAEVAKARADLGDSLTGVRATHARPAGDVGIYNPATLSK